MSGDSKVIDKYAASLAEGCPLEVHGVVVPLAWPWDCNDTTRGLYEDIAERIRKLSSAHSHPLRQLLHVYNMTELHCTAATITSFKDDSSVFSTASDTQRKEIFQLYRSVIAKAIKEIDVHDFHLIVDRIEVVSTACIFRIEDPTGYVAVIREAIVSAMNDLELREYEGRNSLEPFALSQRLHVPNITHSTFVRFLYQPEPNVLRSLEKIAEEWIPQQITVTEIVAVHEHVPYMHEDRTDENTLCILRNI